VLVLLIFIGAFVPVRNLLVPKDFGKYGHYRPAALEEAAALPISYAGHVICNECHDDIVDTKYGGYHKDLACEICHGPSAEHTEDDMIIPPAPRERGYCPLCHEYLASRPTGFPQILAESHNPLKPCISCHDPHDPVPPETPKECEACHAAIARTKAVSHHVYVSCEMCHDAPDEHRIDPRAYRPGKPERRGFCGGCHSDELDVEDVETTVDMATHGEGYVC